MDALVDFIIPTFNRAATIGRTLDSLAAQTDPRWRAIVVDDGSTDGTADEIARRGDDRITVIRQANAGVSAARNTGLRRARSPYVCFLDADDTLDASYCRQMIPAASAARRGAVCGFRYVDGDGVTISESPPPPARALTAPGLMSLDPIAIMSVLHRRESLLSLAGAPNVFDPHLHVFEDWDVLMRLASLDEPSETGDWTFTPETLASYWTTPSSLSSNVEAAYETGAVLLQRYAPNAAEADAAVRAWAVRALAHAIATDTDAAPILAMVGRVDENEMASFTAALRWSLRRWRGRTSDADLEQRLMCCISDVTLRRRTVLAAMDETRWRNLFSLAAERHDLSGRIVLYGMGRNGRAASSEAAGPVFYIDDSPACVSTGTRLQLDDLSAGDVVIVTPDDSVGIVERLRAAGVERILTVDDAIDAAQSAASP